MAASGVDLESVGAFVNVRVRTKHNGDIYRREAIRQGGIAV
jgi:hypothetical protein